QGGGNWTFTVDPPYVCCDNIHTISSVTFSISVLDSSGTTRLTAMVGAAQYQSADMPKNELYLAAGKVQTLNLVPPAPSDTCMYPGTITVQVVPPDESEVAEFCCLMAAENGCPPGWEPAQFNDPDVGSAVSCFNSCTGESVTVP